MALWLIEIREFVTASERTFSSSLKFTVVFCDLISDMNNSLFSTLLDSVVMLYVNGIVTINALQFLFSHFRQNGLAILLPKNHFNLTTPFVHSKVDADHLHLDVYFPGGLSLIFNMLTAFLFFPNSKFSYSNKFTIILEKKKWTFYKVNLFPIFGEGIAAVSDDYDGVLVIWQFGGKLSKALEDNGIAINTPDSEWVRSLRESHMSQPKGNQFFWFSEFKNELRRLESN